MAKLCCKNFVQFFSGTPCIYAHVCTYANCTKNIARNSSIQTQREEISMQFVLFCSATSAPFRYTVSKTWYLFLASDTYVCELVNLEAEIACLSCIMLLFCSILICYSCKSEKEKEIVKRTIRRFHEYITSLFGRDDITGQFAPRTDHPWREE